ncbi:MAG: sulfatase-like hydrolase/transferase [Sphaerochaetaceae bacterium]|nr:sulfatase-like hydrolase/transferase [Sphaerochaetaceae bacterium]
MKKKKNVLVFMTDQQNSETLKSSSKAKTPNLDKFIEKSIKFNNCHTTSPHCCPSRAGFFSGLYPSQHNIWNNVEVDNALSRTLFDGVKLFPEILKEDGYKTYFAGKWHVSAYEGPKDRGFDHVLYEYVSNYGRFKAENKPRSNDWSQVYSNKDNIKLDDSKDFGEIVRNGYPKYYQFGVDDNPFGDNISTSKACEVLENYDSEDPFFMYVGTTGPHDPYCPPQKFLDLYKEVDIELPPNFDDPMYDKPALYRRTRDCFKLTREEHIESIRRYYAFVSYEDYLFGKILDTLKSTNLLEDTYVLVLTDHGDYVASHGLWAKGLPCFKEAYSIGVVLGGADINTHFENNDLLSITDFAPTILELTGNKDKLKTTGKSICPIIKNNKTPKNWRTELFTQTNGNEVYGIQRAVFNDKWKLVFNTFDYDELYDLENDPLEMHNIIDSAPKPVIKDLFKKLWTFAKETNDACTCPYIAVAFAPYGPGIILEDNI